MTREEALREIRDGIRRALSLRVFGPNENQRTLMVALQALLATEPELVDRLLKYCGTAEGEGGAA